MSGIESRESNAKQNTDASSHEATSLAAKLSTELQNEKQSATPAETDPSKVARPQTLQELTHSSKSQLEWLFQNSPAGATPDGFYHGQSIAIPGTKTGQLLSDIEDTIWKGKQFDAKNGHVVNKILGLHIISADVYRGTSVQDGKEAIIVDYGVSGGRDELREVRPGLEIGKGYVHVPFLHLSPVFFALEYEPPKDVLTKHKN